MLLGDGTELNICFFTGSNSLALLETHRDVENDMVRRVVYPCIFFLQDGTPFTHLQVFAIDR